MYKVWILLLNAKDNAFMKYTIIAQICQLIERNLLREYVAQITFLCTIFLFVDLTKANYVGRKEKWCQLQHWKKVIFHHRKEWKQNLFAFYWGHDDNTTQHTKKHVIFEMKTRNDDDEFFFEQNCHLNRWIIVLRL